MKLFTDKGYSQTTVDDIAAAADISPRTFFRYFPSKEMLVIADDLDEILVAAIRAQPDDMPPLMAVRVALDDAFQQVADDDWTTDVTRQQLLFTVPELRSALFSELERTIEMLASLLAERTGRTADDFEVRVTAGAVVGAMMGSGLNTSTDHARRSQALKFLEAGLPLR
ncbi:acyl-CoA-like ligand-binding transcription factor [Jongsikchunia kroppenstedtii]